MNTLSLIFTLCFIMMGVVSSSSSSPSLLLRKYVGFPENSVVPTVGQELIITLQIFNLGSDAYEVLLSDYSELPISVGSDNARWDKVPAGTNYSHTYIIVPARSGDYRMRRAVVQYKDGKGATYETASNEPYALRVYELNEVDRRGGSQLIQWVGFFLLVGLVVGVPGAVYGHIKTNYISGRPKQPLQKDESKKKNQ